MPGREPVPARAVAGLVGRLNPPLLVLVTGAPAAGKTTLAHALGRELYLPVVSRDEIKAAIVRTERLTDVRIGDPIGPRSFALFLRTIASFVDAGASVVAEQAFDRRLATDDLTPLARRTDARIVHCAPPTSVCDDRFRRRAVEDAPRRRAHPDGEVLSMLETGELDWSIWDAPLVEGAAVLRIDTSDGYDPSLAEIVAWCETSRPAP